jgi:hypothetical protein
MAGVGHRHEYNEEIVTFPASKTAGAATITGDMVYPFEASGWGGARVEFIVGDTADVGDTITMKTYVSFTEGDTAGSANWVQVDGDTAVSVASGSSKFRSFYVPFAPRIRVDAAFDAAATLTAGHGCKVNASSFEYDPEAKRTLFEDVGNFGDTYITASTVNGDTMEISYPTKLYIWYGSEGSLGGDTAITVTLQGSQGDTNWFDIVTLSTAVPATGDTHWQNKWEIVERPDLPKYARIKTVIGDTAVTTGGHGMKYYVLAQE